MRSREELLNRVPDLDQRIDRAIELMESLLKEGWSMQYAKGMAGIKSGNAIFFPIKEDPRYLKLLHDYRCVHKSAYGVDFKPGYQQPDLK